MDTATVTKILKYNDNDTRPIAAEFQNGRLTKTSMQHDMFKKNKQTFIKIETKNQFIGELKPDSVFNNFIAIVNKDNEAVLVPVDYTLLMPDVKVDEESEKNEVDYSAAVRSLKREFGSKRAKLMVQQEDRMRMNTKNTAQALQEAVNEMDVDENDLEMPSETGETAHKPPINRNAATVEEVYDLYTLLPKTVLDSVDGTILNGEIDSLVYTTFIKNELMKKFDLEPTEKVEEQCKILLVVDCILNFLSLPLKTIGNRKFVACEYSQEVSKYVLDTFTLPGRNGRNRSNSMKDKALCYCIVLLALVNNYQVNLEDFCRTLPVKINKMQTLAKHLAFVPLKSKDKSVIVLKLPLPPPVKTIAHTPKRKR